MKYRKQWIKFQWPMGNIKYILYIRERVVRRRLWVQKIFEEIIAENVPNLMKILGTKIQEVQPT